MIVAQAPGECEDREGKMFVGPSGQITDELMDSAGVSRDEVYMTNLLKCFLPKCRRPKQDEIARCREYLEREIESVAPEVIVTLGYYAARYFFEKHGLALPPRAEMHTIRGRLYWVGDRKILALRHPSALLYSDALKNEMITDYRKLHVLLTECKWYPVCPMRWFYEEGRLDREWIELNCRGDWESCFRYQMEEKGETCPDYILPDGTRDERLEG
jgi:DNA polymerase